MDLAGSAFYNYNVMDTFTQRADVSMEECEAFIAENLTAEKLAMSVVVPGGA